MPPSASQTLPKKENNIFKGLSKLHEKKQFKRALRDCDAILKVNPDHGETLAMKGLTLNFLNKKTEAYDLVRLGIRKNIMSPICWHVYGLLYRSDGDYKEAKKCYLQAMKRDKNNLHILRDLSLLQIQLRDLPGYLRTRKALLHLKKTANDSWYTFCMAWELLGHYNEAIDVMTAFEEITEASEKLKFGKVQANFENGERKMYIARLYQQAERYQECLDYIKNNEDVIVDKHGMKVMRAEIYMKMKNYDEAKVLYRELIDTNPENHDFHIALQRAYQIRDCMDELSDKQISELENLYEEFRKAYPRCSALKTIPLRFHKAGEKFQKELDAYLQPALRKGVPSLFATLRFFYENSPDKATIIGDTVQRYYTSLKETQHFPGNESEEEIEPPLSLLWSILFLAQHYDQLGEHETALKFIDEAIEHTPTVVDIYSFRADIYKNAGAVQKAADAMDECRELDLADRYLNTKSTIFLMEADRVEQGDETVALFITDADGNRVSLSEMQCVWYEQAAAESYLRTKDYGKSLKKALSINSHFEEFIEDQFDFHTYCVSRKLTFRAYRDLLTFEDKLYSHDNYFKAACVIVKNYIALHERPTDEQLAEQLFAKLEGKELQKARNKWKKTQRKKQQQAEKKKAELEKEHAQKRRAGLTVDDDPDGEALEQVKNPLDEASKFVSSLEKWCSNRLETHLLAFEVFYKKQKYLRALRALKKCLSMDSSNPIAHYQTIQLSLVNKSEIDESVRSVFVEGLESVTGGLSASELNKKYSDANSGVLSQFAVARSELLINPDSKESLKERITAFPDAATRKECETILSYIQDLYSDSEAVTLFKQKAHEKFPLANAFE